MTGQRIPFTREDEERIASAGLWGVIAALTSIASTVLGLLFVVVSSASAQLFGQLLSSAVSMLLGLLLIQASASFRGVALSDGEDQRLLIQGFDKLRLYFKVTGIVIIVIIAIAFLALLFLMTCGTMLLAR